MRVKRKPKGYWKNKQNRIKEAKKVMEKEGWDRLPCDTILIKHGYSGLNNAIIRYDRGMKKMRKLLGQENIFGKLKNLNYVLSMAKEIMKKEGWERLPANRILERKGYSGFSGAMREYHRGITNIRKLLGQQNYLKPYKYWKKWENVERKLKKAIKENNGEFPSKNKLIKLGYGGIINPIKDYFGGMSAVREKIGYNEQTRIKLTKGLEEIAKELVA